MKPIRFLTLCMAFLALLAFVPAPAHATLTITPTIVVIEGRARYADINIINTSKLVKTYEMSWKFFRMTEGTGAYENIDASLTEFDLTKHLVFSPRRVTLAPGGRQKIRMALRLNGEPPPPGDYRAHFEMMQVQTQIDGESEDERVKVGININVGFSVPVIYRVGEGAGDARIGDVSPSVNLKTGKIEITVPLTRTPGPYGTLGHIKIFYKKSGSEKLVGELVNANIFSEITQRVFRLPLNVDELSGGSLRIVYQDQNPRSGIVFDQKTVPVGE